MTSQSTLGSRFLSGKLGAASNVHIEEHEWGGTMLVGYGHAVYAYRFENGFVIAFMGWYEKENTRRHAGSPSTKTQYGKLGLRTADHKVMGTGEDAAPKLDEFHPGEWELVMLDERGLTA